MYATLYAPSLAAHRTRFVLFCFVFWFLFVSLFAFWLDLGSMKSESVFLLGLAYMIQPTKVKQLK